MNNQFQQASNSSNSSQQNDKSQDKKTEKMAKFPDWDILPKSQFINPRINKVGKN